MGRQIIKQPRCVATTYQNRQCKRIAKHNTGNQRMCREHFAIDRAQEILGILAGHTEKERWDILFAAGLWVCLDCGYGKAAKYRGCGKCPRREVE